MVTVEKWQTAFNLREMTLFPDPTTVEICVCIILQDPKINIDAINSPTDSDDGVCCKINHYRKNEVEFKSTDEEAERLVDYMQRSTKAFVKKVPQCQNEDTMHVAQSHKETQV